jgi:hypothetical protein
MNQVLRSVSLSDQLNLRVSRDWNELRNQHLLHVDWHRLLFHHQLLFWMKQAFMTVYLLNQVPRVMAWWWTTAPSVISTIEVNAARADSDNVLALRLCIDSGLVWFLEIVECGVAKIEFHVASLIRHSFQCVVHSGAHDLVLLTPELREDRRPFPSVCRTPTNGMSTLKLRLTMFSIESWLHEVYLSGSEKKWVIPTRRCSTSTNLGQLSYWESHWREF